MILGTWVFCNIKVVTPLERYPFLSVGLVTLEKSRSDVGLAKNPNGEPGDPGCSNRLWKLMVCVYDVKNIE